MRWCRRHTISSTIGLLLALAIIVPVSAATPPDPDLSTPLAVPKPADLPLRLPWAAGESHGIWNWYYNPDNTIRMTTENGGYDHICGGTGYSQDCYALDFDSMTTATQIYPAFGGTVLYAGCASGNWSTYGQIVFIERKLSDGHRYDALYTHLSTIESAVKTAANNRTTIGDNAPIGKAGNTSTSPSGDCLHPYPNNSDPRYNMAVHLHFALYQDAKFSSGDGGPHDGVAVIPEPFVGQQVYENFLWWRGSMTATDLASGAADPTGHWLAPSSGISSTLGGLPTPLPSNQPVHFRVHVVDPKVDIKEVHFTVYYPEWNAVNGIQPPTPPMTKNWPFPGDRIWRILAICKPTDKSSGSAKCRWNGSARSADVSFDWFPSLEHGTIPSLVPWLPSANPVSYTGTPPEAQVNLSFDVISTGGVEKLAPAGIRRSTTSAGRLIALRQSRPYPLSMSGLDSSSIGRGRTLPASWAVDRPGHPDLRGRHRRFRVSPSRAAVPSIAPASPIHAVQFIVPRSAAQR